MSQDRLIQVWRCQWGTKAELRRWSEAGLPFLPAARLEDTISLAYQKGQEAGEQQGRFNLRRDIENGEVAPIQPKEVSK